MLLCRRDLHGVLHVFDRKRCQDRDPWKRLVHANACDIIYLEPSHAPPTNDQLLGQKTWEPAIPSGILFSLSFYLSSVANDEPYNITSWLLDFFVARPIRMRRMLSQLHD